MSLTTLNGQIKTGNSKVFRTIEIKRRLSGTGIYETDWQDITDDVINFGTIKKEVDSTRVNQFKFSSINLKLNNNAGKYNSFRDENSFWFGYADQQRTLVRIKAGFLYQTKANGIWTNTYIPSTESEQIIYSGYISGDINLSGEQFVNIPVVPLSECFRQFAASRLTGYNASLTASSFMTLLRDQQDAFGQYIFRPFFGNTTTNWEITPTTNVYSNLNTSTAEELINLTVWEVIQKLSEAENFVPYVTSNAVFRFAMRDETTTVSYNFFGPGGFDNTYGRQIKKISFFGNRFSKYYSRVKVQFNSADTVTSYYVADSQYIVSSSSGPWLLGERTLNVTNFWIPNTATAQTLATDLFDEYSALRNELEFSTSFIPNVDVFNRVTVSYDQSEVYPQTLWDVYNWGDDGTTITGSDLLWDSSPGDAIKLNAEEFRVVSVEINLDQLECKYTLRS